MEEISLPNIIDEAIEYLQTKGWCQLALFKRQLGGPACLEGSLLAGIGCPEESAMYPIHNWLSPENDALLTQAHRILDDIVHEQSGLYFSDSFVYWNDIPGRTFEEVIAVMKKASARINEELELSA